MSSSGGRGRAIVTDSTGSGRGLEGATGGGEVSTASGGGSVSVYTDEGTSETLNNAANFLANNIEYDRDGWQVVKNKNRHRPRRAMQGTHFSSDDDSTFLRAAPKIHSLFLGGCFMDTTSDEVESHCDEVLGVKTIKVERLQTRSVWSSCFKIQVYAADKERLLDENKWPKGSYIRRFWTPRVDYYNNTNDSRYNENSNSNSGRSSALSN